MTNKLRALLVATIISFGGLVWQAGKKSTNCKERLLTKVSNGIILSAAKKNRDGMGIGYPKE